MRRQTLEQGMVALLKVFPDKKMDCETFWVFLKDLSDEEFMKAILDLITTQKEIYPGTNIIALIRERAKVGKVKLAGEAWTEVLREISRIGSYGKPEFSDPLILKSVLSLGWRNLCLSENIMIERAHFFRVFEAYVNRENRLLMIGKLVDGKENHTEQIKDSDVKKDGAHSAERKFY